ncbi:hypothetical protein ABZ714_04470 [Streptomyces sp. NPDC006798]|uniref:hypothetical protein n=1 Tax=Streptomyces sp. NPDC006798 TaxID=3155462 RepID=UPI0033C891A9
MTNIDDASRDGGYRGIGRTRVWAWRITDRPAGALVSAGLREFPDGSSDQEVANRIMESVRGEHPHGALGMHLWVQVPPSGEVQSVPWDSDRDPHGGDPVPPDASAFLYAGPGEEAAAQARAAAVVDALRRHDSAASVAAKVATNAVARLSKADER